MKYRDVAERLSRPGCREVDRRSSGSHRKWVNAATGKATVLPDWGSRDLKLGTVRAIVRQLGLSWEEFQRTRHEALGGLSGLARPCWGPIDRALEFQSRSCRIAETWAGLRARMETILENNASSPRRFNSIAVGSAGPK